MDTLNNVNKKRKCEGQESNSNPQLMKCLTVGMFFLSPVYIATVLIYAAVNWVFCFAYILIVAFVAFDQV